MGYIESQGLYLLLMKLRMTHKLWNTFIFYGGGGQQLLEFHNTNQHICSIKWSFWAEATLSRVFYRLFIYVLPMETQLCSGGGYAPIKRSNSAIPLCRSPHRTWISNIICSCLMVSLSIMFVGIVHRIISLASKCSWKHLNCLISFIVK
jgi:hypothetical protein